MPNNNRLYPFFFSFYGRNLTVDALPGWVVESEGPKCLTVTKGTRMVRAAIETDFYCVTVSVATFECDDIIDLKTSVFDSRQLERAEAWLNIHSKKGIHLPA